MKVSAIITAGGTSSRYGNTNKLLEKIYEKTVIEYTVEAFLNAKVDEIVICANKSIMYDLRELLPEHVRIVEGGATRQESVYNGLKAVEGCDYVLIHDGARPMIPPETINLAIEKVKEQKALTVATKTTDTIKVVDESGKIVKTLDRSKLYNTQTPQAFEYKLIRDIHEKLKEKSFTDDAGMVESFGFSVYVLEGGYQNIKITTKSDLELAKAYLKKDEI